MVEVVALILAFPFSALCACCCFYVLKRHEREHKKWMRELSLDYKSQWQEFEVEHKGKFEDDYWNTVINKPEAPEYAR